MCCRMIDTLRVGNGKGAGEGKRAESTACAQVDGHDSMIIDQTWRSSERNESICGPKLDYNILLCDDGRRSQGGSGGRGGRG